MCLFDTVVHFSVLKEPIDSSVETFLTEEWSLVTWYSKLNNVLSTVAGEQSLRPQTTPLNSDSPIHKDRYSLSSHRHPQQHLLRV